MRFLPESKITEFDRRRLAFDAIALQNLLGETPQVGWIIHRDPRSGTTINGPPTLVLNRHRPDCEFLSQCRLAAVEHDDLSLLKNMTEKERSKLNDWGILTIEQLSYTFRPKRVAEQRHGHSLKALAIRTKRVHVIGSPNFAIDGRYKNLNFLDVLRSVAFSLF